MMNLQFLFISFSAAGNSNSWKKKRVKRKKKKEQEKIEKLWYYIKACKKLRGNVMRRCRPETYTEDEFRLTYIMAQIPLQVRPSPEYPGLHLQL